MLSLALLTVNRKVSRLRVTAVSGDNKRLVATAQTTRRRCTQCP